jgi:hypothetical protein
MFKIVKVMLSKAFNNLSVVGRWVAFNGFPGYSPTKDSPDLLS